VEIQQVGKWSKVYYFQRRLLILNARVVARS